MKDPTPPKAARTAAAVPPEGEDPAVEAEPATELYQIFWERSGLPDNFVRAEEMVSNDPKEPTLFKTHGEVISLVMPGTARMIGRIPAEAAALIEAQWYDEMAARAPSPDAPETAGETREAGMPGVAVRFPPRLMSAVELLAGIDGKDPEMWVRDLVDIAVEVQLANTQVPGPAPVAERARPELPWGSYEIRFAGGARTIVQAKELTEYTDGTWSLEADGRTVGLGSRAGVASIARLN